MDTLTPAAKIRVSRQKCGQRAAAYLRKKRVAAVKACDLDVDAAFSYVPYWIGRIETVKARAFPLYPDKKITFYLVCDGIDGEYIVLRNIPEAKKEAVARGQVLTARISEGELEGRIADEAIKTCINKQFIFGPPQITSRSQYVLYLPVRRVRIRQGSAGENGDLHVNTYTGEVKQYGILPGREGL